MAEQEPVGSLAEEAAKLFAAVQGWAASKDLAGGAAAADEAADDADGDAPGQQHVHGADSLTGECRYCPICQVVRYTRATSPEVRDHLASAAVSMTLAIRGLLENVERERSSRSEPVEKIDLMED